MTAAMIGYSFIGNGKYCSSSIIKAAQKAMRPPMVVIDESKESSILEDPDICLHNELLNKFGSKNAEELLQLGGCRPILRFIHTSSLKAARTFMNGSLTDQESAQLNTLYRFGYLPNQPFPARAALHCF